MSQSRTSIAASIAVVPAVLSDAYSAFEHAHAAKRADEVAELIALCRVCDAYAISGTTVVEGCERLVRFGGDGTPEVGEFVVAELAALMRCGTDTARAQVRRALNLRHRHPQLWEATVAGLVPVWQAFLVTDACAGLAQDACLWVDAQVAIASCLQPFPRVMRQVEGWVLAADPAAAAERAGQAESSRYVRVEGIVDGACGVSARLSAGDGLALDDALTVVAAALPVVEDHEVRRATALGVLARAVLGQDALLAPEVPAEELPTAQGSTSEAPTSEAPSALVLAAAAPSAVMLGAERPATAAHDGLAVLGRLGDHLTAGQPRRATVVVHINRVDLPAPERGVAEVERWGHVLASQVREVLSGCQVTVRPILDPEALAPSDAYEVPEVMRFALHQRNPVDVFPFGTRAARACDTDHTQPFDAGAPPGAGQTNLTNLGPLARFSHRVKTHGGWQVTQPTPGTYCWRSRAGYEYTVSAAGTVMARRPTAPGDRWWLREEPPPLEPEPPA